MGKEYLKLIKELKKVIAKRGKLKEFNLSASGWQDSYSQKERDRLYKHNEQVQKTKKVYDSLICDILRRFEEAGYTRSDLADCLTTEEFESISLIVTGVLGPGITR